MNDFTADEFKVMLQVVKKALDGDLRAEITDDLNVNDEDLNLLLSKIEQFLADSN